MKVHTKEELEAAAFWDRAVCLECDEAVEADDVPEGDVCPNCGDPDSLVAASLLVRVGEYLDLLEK